MILGISLVAVVVAAGCIWLGNTCQRKRIGSGTPNAWAAFVFYLIGGMAAALAVRPMVGWLTGFTWIVLLATFACLVLLVSAALDIGADKRPDAMAMTAAKVGPTLALVAVAHWATFTNTVGTQVTTYMTQLGG